jgi:hypothetical protein
MLISTGFGGNGLFDAFIKAFSLIGKKPGILLPALITSGLNILAATLLFDQIVDVVIGTAYLNEFPYGGLFESIPLVMQQYASSLIPMFVTALILGVINISFIYVYARFAKQPSLSGAFGFAFGKLKEVITLIIFFLLITLLVSGLFFLVVVAGFTWHLITMVVGTLMALILFYLFLRLVFFIPIMAIENVNLKAGLQGSWKFTQKRTLSVLALFIVMGLINLIISQIETFINAALETAALDELFIESLGFGLPPFLVSLIAALIVFTYTGLVVPLYYLKFKAR